MSETNKLIRKTYLSAIANSVDTKIFKNFFIQIDSLEKDAMKNGNLSCAFFVSGILTMFGFIESIHGTVKSTIEDLEKSGWVKTRMPQKGDVLVWEAKTFDDGTHQHIGFYIGDDHAISNDAKAGVPSSHHWTYKNTRKIELIFHKEITT